MFAVLAAADAYADWWPQIRAVTRLGPDDGEVHVRSLLPWTLRLRLHRAVTDAAAGRLAVRLAGDLTGWASWEVRPEGPGSVAAYRQEVDLAAPGLARVLRSPAVARLARPVLVANHDWMMRSGERGLRRRLVGQPG